MTLDELLPGQACVVRDVHLEGAVLQRLLDMGFVEGARIEVVRNAPLLDPIDIRIRNNLIAVRRSEAGGIEVERV
ncbi:MAG: FeoA family protein [Desulfomonilaceae bacterium]|nr:FeoA family protein [Desulfomonilaceae bacterium]